MHITGGCHCGAIRYEAELDPERVTICHCTDCQALTGTAYRVTVRVARDAFKLLSGTPSVYVKTADSGARRAQAFCPNCGSPIHASAMVDPVSYGLRLGGIDQRRELRPRLQIWCRSALEWSQDLREVPRRDAE